MLNDNLYNITTNLSSACRALAIAIGGVLFAEVLKNNMKETLPWSIPLVIFLILDIAQYLSSLITVHKIYRDVLKDKCNIEEAQIKLLAIQRTAFTFVYCKVGVLIIALIMLAIYIVIQ